MRFTFYNSLALAALFATQARNTVNAVQVESAYSDDEFAETFAELDNEDNYMDLIDENTYAQLEQKSKKSGSSGSGSESGSQSSSGSGSSSGSDSKSSSGSGSQGDKKAQIGAESFSGSSYGDYLAQINAEYDSDEDNIYAFAQSEGVSQGQPKVEEESTPSSVAPKKPAADTLVAPAVVSAPVATKPAASKKSSSSSDEPPIKPAVKAQIDSYDYSEELAQLNADIEEQEGNENLQVFADFMAQIGIEESDHLLAQLTSEFGQEHMWALASDPTIYESLAQLAKEYHDEIFAQVGADSLSENQSDINSEVDSEVESAVFAEGSSSAEASSYAEAEPQSASDAEVNEYAQESVNEEFQFVQVSAEDGDPVEQFSNFLTQIGVDPETILSQLAANGISEDQLKIIGSDPSFYQGLAELAKDYRDEQIDLAQTWTEDVADDYAF